MGLIRIALDNLKRRKTKALILVVGLFIAVATSVTLFTTTVAMRENIDAQLDEFGTNLLITPKYKELPLNYGGVVISNVSSEPAKELNLSDVDKMRTIKVKDNLNVISPKLIGPVNYRGKTVPLVGIQFVNELRIKTWWQYIGKKPLGKTEAVAGKNLIKKQAVAGTNFSNNEVISGANFAKKFNIKPGNQINLSGSTYTVASVLKNTGSSDDNVLFIDLEEAQKVLNKPGKISLIEANAFCLDCPLKTIATQLQGKLPYAKVFALKESMATKQESLSVFQSLSIASSISVVLIAAVIILVTMMASVKERTREIGIFRAIGFRKKHVFIIIMSEATTVGLIGGLSGYFAGFLISKMLVPIIAPQAIGFYFNPNTINLVLMGISSGGALLMGVLASIYPAYKAAKLDPASALRFI